MKTTSSLFCVLGYGLLSLASWAGESQDKAAELLEYEEPIYPFRAEIEGIFDGSVTILLDLDMDGKVTDYLPLTASSHHFLEPIERVVYDWVFKPAMRGGLPVGSIKKFDITFKAGDIMSITLNSAISAAFLYDIHGGMRRLELVAALKDLDALPTPIDIVKPLRYQNMADVKMKGRVVFDFFIDEAGKVRMPLMVDNEGDLLLAESAAIALSQWRFEPPMKNGRPVVARARQEFRFGN